MYSERKRVKGFVMHFYCSQVQRQYIELSARKNGKLVSPYLRELALQGFVDDDKTLPSEVMAFTGLLQHVIGQLEIISRMRLDDEDLNAVDRAQLAALRGSIEEIVEKIKKYLS